MERKPLTTDVAAPSCMRCRHYDFGGRLNPHKNACAAFPDGIPEEILLSRVQHVEPYPGDHGIRFEPRLER